MYTATHTWTQIHTTTHPQKCAHTPIHTLQVCPCQHISYPCVHTDTHSYHSEVVQHSTIHSGIVEHVFVLWQPNVVQPTWQQQRSSMTHQATPTTTKFCDCLLYSHPDNNKVLWLPFIQSPWQQHSSVTAVQSPWQQQSSVTAVQSPWQQQSSVTAIQSPWQQQSSVTVVQ